MPLVIIFPHFGSWKCELFCVSFKICPAGLFLVILGQHPVVSLGSCADS